MKNIILKMLLSMSIIFLATSCSSHTAMNSYSVSGPTVLVDDERLESNITIGDRISGTGSCTYLFGCWPLGDTHHVAGVWGGGLPFFSTDHAKMEATYDALVSSGADMIVEPRYEIVTKKTFFITTVTAKVHGHKGVIDSYTQYKQDKPSYMEEKYGYKPTEGSLKIEIDK